MLKPPALAKRCTLRSGTDPLFDLDLRSPAYIDEPDTNRCTWRSIHTLKEHGRWVQLCDTLNSSGPRPTIPATTHQTVHRLLPSPYSRSSIPRTRHTCSNRSSPSNRPITGRSTPLKQ